MRMYRFMMLASLGLLLPLTGCYERVISERPFAGMAATRTPTANEYPSAADAGQLEIQKKEKPFDPIGDWILKPIGGAASSIGNAFSGDPEPEQPQSKPGTRPATSANDVSNSPPPAKGKSDFDLAP